MHISPFGSFVKKVGNKTEYKRLGVVKQTCGKTSMSSSTSV